MAKIATKREIDEHWSIDDLADAHDALDIDIEMQEVAARKAEKEARKGLKK